MFSFWARNPEESFGVFKYFVSRGVATLENGILFVLFGGGVRKQTLAILIGYF